MFPSDYVQEVMKVEGFSVALEELKQKLSEYVKNKAIKPFPKILFLGTGSCIPNKTRNTSGILLQLRYCKSISNNRFYMFCFTAKTIICC